MDMFTTRKMLPIVEEAQKTTNTFLRDRFFTYRPTFDTQKIDFDIIGKGGRKIAPFVNPKIGGVVVTRDGYKTESYEAPELSPMRVTTAEDMLKRLPGEALYSGKSPNERAAEILGRDLSDLDDIITRREEVMCAQALFEGKIDIVGEGYDEEVSYWAHLQTADKPVTTLTTKWDASGATADTIMQDLRTSRRAMIQAGGFTPRDMILGSRAVDVLISKLVAAQALDSRRVDMGQIDPQHLPNGVTYWGYLKDSGLDVFSYDEWYQADDGTEKPMVPADACMLAAHGVKTMLAYGVVSLTGDEQVKFYEGARVPDSWVQRANPSGRIVQIKSRPLPVVQQIQGFHLINALTAQQ